jgi:hypothetical protein
MNRKGKVASLLALATMGMAQPAQACWTVSEQDAAKIANLNMMMMVSALRCRKGADDFLGDYNRFVKNNNPVLGAQNAAVRGHFARIDGAKVADRQMDRFVIGLANSYGGGTDSKGCDQLKSVAFELGQKSHSAKSLLSIAEANIDTYPLPGGTCPVAIAAK